jgi:hypothetical protein
LLLWNVIFRRVLGPSFQPDLPGFHRVLLVSLSKSIALSSGGDLSAAASTAVMAGVAAAAPAAALCVILSLMEGGMLGRR